MMNGKENTESYETRRTQEIFDQRKELFIKKNQNYGAAWAKIGRILEIITDGKMIKLNDYWDTTLFSLLIRMLDKIIRVVNLRFVDDKDKVGESVSETLGDLGVYSFMAQSSVDHQLQEVEKDGKKD